METTKIHYVHHIQQKILSLLLYTPKLTYAQLRPKGIESNHFAYHLEQLIKAGYVAKQTNGYVLTTEGLAFADRASHDRMTVRKQPHIVTTIHITNNFGQTLVFTHTFQPYLNLRGYPQGRTHFEESVVQAAERELAEKSGLIEVSLTHRGMLYITTTKDTTISKILSHVFSGTVKGAPELASQNPQRGFATWEDTDTLSQKACMPGFWQIKDLLETNTDFFFAEIQCEMPEQN